MILVESPNLARGLWTDQSTGKNMKLRELCLGKKPLQKPEKVQSGDVISF